jgi:fumarylpyruvate hydrolase
MTMTSISYVIPPQGETGLPVEGGGIYPVRRIYCVGRNYISHIREMQEADERDPPFFFQKPRDSLVPHPCTIAYPPLTQDFQYEVELVVAIGAEGKPKDPQSALSMIYGYAVGLDMTRRDRQRDARAAMLPWEIGKSFDASAPCGNLMPVGQSKHLHAGAISLSVNGEQKQSGDIEQMIWNVGEIIVQLSKQVRLRPGDLIMTGTPSGVGPLQIGDHIDARIDGLPALSVTITSAEAE